MAEGEGGGTKVLRGLLIAALIVALIVLLAVYWRQVVDAFNSAMNYLGDHFPDQTGQQVAVVVYLIFAVIFGIVFSKAGHFTAYGIVTALLPLLWFLFWEGFPPLGLNPSWKASLGVDHLAASQVVLWAIVGAAVSTLVFVPLELREKWQRRKHSLANTD